MVMSVKNGIVILNYNDYETTSTFLKKIKNFKILDYIIVVDNKSTDNSYQLLKSFEDKKIKVILSEENRGYASGNNLGIKYLVDNMDVDNIIISNPDISLKESDIVTLISDLNLDYVSCVAPIIKENESIIKGFKLPTFLSEVISNIPIIRRLEFKILSYNSKNYKEDLTNVDVVKGCFFVIKKDVFEKIGYFDDNTFLYYEEIIMAHKLKELGYNTYVDNRVEISHDLSKSVDKSVKKLNKFKYLKSSQYYYEKEINKIHPFKLIIIRVFYYIYLFLLKIVILFKK